MEKKIAFIGKDPGRRKVEGCGVLFKSGSGILICGEERVDGSCFLCKRCLEDLQ